MVFGLGAIFIILLILSFTRVPFDIYRWLGEYGTEYQFKPEKIIMLGGSGMPSESNLIRLYYTADIAQHFPSASIIIAHPEDTAVTNLMGKYLNRNGVDSTRINYMLIGTNTREQVLNLQKSFEGLEQNKIIVITSPENMYRTISVFEKLKFRHITGVSAFENAMFVDLNYNHQQIGGKVYSPDVSGSLNLRYNFWNYLKLEITCLREFAAIFYYKLNGWI